MLVRARVVGYADTDAEARRIVSGVRVTTTGGSVRADGPDGGADARWSVSFEVQVPRTALLTLNTNNGGISIEDFHGTAKFRAHNGGVSLDNVSGDIRGETTNGGVTIDPYAAIAWDGAGLDVETRNGGIRMSAARALLSRSRSRDDQWRASASIFRSRYRERSAASSTPRWAPAARRSGRSRPTAA